ncbi:alpha/beta hydrolase [Arthrobacter sp. AZCC_0090]|uniref:alpha/beta hydrolase n=1 Tax=Arthrobacter sp. AZCC_0090 TaxID=2735881 RepID=UPI0016227C61|nr:alpha/beta hydrolase [Arthrobacter sp. AZCC_0090]MBB6405097.1 acetyl esterase/lipase [Arthrobacter sp. AZCC_0090]
MTSTLSRPPYIPDVAAVIDTLSGQITMTLLPEGIEAGRAHTATFREDLSGFAITRRDLVIPGFGGTEIELSIFVPDGTASDAPCIFHLHGGGMVMGDRFTGISAVLPWAIDHGAILTTVEYRLAPEHPDPTPVEDCYAALVWISDHAGELGIDGTRILVTGNSAGGGLAAGISLMARDRRGPAILGQLLVYPMLDDRDSTTSTLQFDGVGLWDRESNVTAWNALLGDRRGTHEVSIYAAPARATYLSGLPPTYIDVASAEVFRDENVAFASQIWADGGVAELHVWPGGTHGFELLAPRSRIAEQAARTRNSWLRDMFDGDSTARSEKAG